MFITELMQKIDSQLQTYTFDAYHALVGAHQNAIGLVVALYFIFLGYRLLMAKTHLSYSHFLEHVLIVSCCYFAATHWSVYSLFIYDMAMALPNALSISLVSVVPGMPGELSGIELLEYLWFSGLEVSATLWGAVSIAAIHQGLMALGVLLMTLLLVGYGLLVISLAKMILAIGLSLAPLFILLYMFKAGESLFLGWMRVILTMMVKQIIIFAMIAMVYTLAFSTVEEMLSYETIDMVDVSTFLLLLFISLGLFFSASHISAVIGESLGAGLSLYTGQMRTYLQNNFNHVKHAAAFNHEPYAVSRIKSPRVA